MAKPFIRPKPSFLGNTLYKSEKTITLDNLAGGMNNVDPETVIADNETTDSMNMMFIANSLMETRYGTKYVDEDTYPDLDKPITWVDEYRPKIGESEYIRATDSEIYVGNTKICDVNGRVRGVNYIGKYYFVDGKYLWVYDGTTYYKVCNSNTHVTEEVPANGKEFHVKSIPEYLTTSKPIHIRLAGGTKVNLTISSIDRDNNTITVTTGHTSAIPKDTVIYFYTPLTGATVFDGTEVWDDTNHYAYYEPCENQLNDDFAGTPYLPDSIDIITVHKDRLFLAGDKEQPHGVYVSAMASISPLYFPAVTGINAKPDGEKIVDLVVFDDALIIGRHKDMYVLYGSSEYQNISDDPFYIKQMDVSTGFMSANCGAMLNNFYIYLGYDGRFYRLNTPTTFVEYLMTKPLDWKINLYAKPFNFSNTSPLEVSAVPYFNEVYFNIGTNCVLVYNYDVQGWTYYVGFNEDCLYSDGINLLIGRHDGKFTMFDKSGENYNDLDEPIENHFYTKKYDFGASDAFKYFTRFMISSSAWEELASYINVSLEIDNYTIDDAYLFSSNRPRFGIATWGETFFNGGELVKSGWKNLDVRGRTIKFKFSNKNDNEPFRIYDVNIGYSIRDVR